jgi:hypothetical protein
MTALAGPPSTRSTPTRRARAGRVADAALRGGLLAAAVAAVAWLLAVAVAGTAFVVLLLATVAVIAYVLLRGGARLGVWAALAVAWAVVALEHWVVNEHGGLWVAAAAWLGVVLAARRAGLSRWALPLLAYPVILGAIVVVEDERLLSPWGVSWLWVAAVLGPVAGMRTLLRPPPAP